MSRYVYQNRTEAPTYSTPVVGYYSVIDPRWTELVAGALNKAQARWDTGVETMSKYNETMSQVPVSPLDREVFEKALAERVKNIKNTISNTYKGDIGAALDYIKEQVSDMSLVNPAKMSYQWFQNMENLYNNLASRGVAPVKYVRDAESGEIKPVEVTLEEFLNEQKAKTLKIDDSGNLIYLSPNISISPRGDYDQFINNLVSDIQNYGYSTTKENSDGNITMATSVQGFNETTFNNYLKSNKDLWDKTVNTFIAENPSVLKEFLDERGRLDRTLVSDFLKQAITSRLYRKTSTKEVEKPDGSQATNNLLINLLGSLGNKKVEFNVKDTLPINDVHSEEWRVFNLLEPSTLSTILNGNNYLVREGDWMPTDTRNGPGMAIVSKPDADRINERRISDLNKVLSKYHHLLPSNASKDFNNLSIEERLRYVKHIKDILDKTKRVSINEYYLANAGSRKNVLDNLMISVETPSNLDKSKADAVSVDFTSKVPSLKVYSGNALLGVYNVSDQRFIRLYKDGNKLIESVLRVDIPPSGKEESFTNPIAMPSFDGSKSPTTIHKYKVTGYNPTNGLMNVEFYDDKGNKVQVELDTVLRMISANMMNLFNQ